MASLFVATGSQSDQQQQRVDASSNYGIANPRHQATALKQPSPGEKKGRPSRLSKKPVFEVKFNFPDFTIGDAIGTKWDDGRPTTPEAQRYQIQGSDTCFRPLGAPVASGVFGEVSKAKRVRSESPAPPDPFVAIKETTRDDSLSELPVHRYLPPQANIIGFLGTLGLHERRAAFAWAAGGSFAEILHKLTQNAGGNAVLVDNALCLLLSDVCSGFAHLHAHRVMHLDIKPANMLINGDGTGVVGDFGEAHAFGEPPADNVPGWQQIRHISHVRKTPGTIMYAAPEILCTPATAGPEADVWSFGLMAHQIITGNSFVDTTRFSEDIYPLNIAGQLALEAQEPGLYAKHAASRLAVTVPAGLPSAPQLHNMLTRTLVLDPHLRPSMDELRLDPMLSTFTYEIHQLRQFIAESVAAHGS